VHGFTLAELQQQSPILRGGLARNRLSPGVHHHQRQISESGTQTDAVVQTPQGRAPASPVSSAPMGIPPRNPRQLFPPNSREPSEALTLGIVDDASESTVSASEPSEDAPSANDDMQQLLQRFQAALSNMNSQDAERVVTFMTEVVEKSAKGHRFPQTGTSPSEELTGLVARLCGPTGAEAPERPKHPSKRAKGMKRSRSEGSKPEEVVGVPLTAEDVQMLEEQREDWTAGSPAFSDVDADVSDTEMDVLAVGSPANRHDVPTSKMLVGSPGEVQLCSHLHPHETTGAAVKPPALYGPVVPSLPLSKMSSSSRLSEDSYESLDTGRSFGSRSSAFSPRSFPSPRVPSRALSDPIHSITVSSRR